MSEETIADVLNAHVQSARNQRCSCNNWRPDYSTGEIGYGRQHRAHQAEMVFELVDEALDEAWAASR